MKDLENNILDKTWSTGIFTIPNDLYYCKLTENLFKNEYENDWGIADNTCNVYQYRSNFSGRY